MTARVLRDRENGLTNPAAGNGQTLPGYLRQLRISRHYRQNFVASKLNISRQTYSHYETGRIRPPAGALYGLAKLYGIPVENLLSCMMFGRYGIENPREGHGGLEYRDSKYEELQCRDTEDENPLEYDLSRSGASRMEGQLLSYFRSLNEKDKEDILSIARLKTRNRGEKEDQNAECKATV